MSDVAVPPPPMQFTHAGPEPWQREVFGHAPEYAAEFVGTAFLMFCVVAAVAVMFANASPLTRFVPSVALRLFITGIVLGGAGGLVAISPVGRISGAHLNPAVSIGFFAEGKMKFNDLVPYVIAQMLGAWLGAWAATSLFPQLAKGVADALNQPGNHVSAAMAVAAEFASTFALASLVFFMVSRHSLMKWTPLGVTFAVGIIVWLDGNFSGASLNPARSFGPVLTTGDWHLYWIYVAGPVAGAATAGLLHRFGASSKAKTGKLYHDRHYRSIFNGESDHAANAHVRQHSGQSTKAPPKAAPPVHQGTDSNGE